MGDYYYCHTGNWDAPGPAAAGDYVSGYHRPYGTVAAAGDYQDSRCRSDFRPASAYGDGRAYAGPPWTAPQEQSHARPGRRRHASGGGGSSSAWCFGDPEMKRRRRVASYKAYTAEGKLKASLLKGFRWIKGKCAGLVEGF